MNEDARYEPSPLDRERAQVALYEATDGAEGDTLEGRPIVILTHVGAKSGPAAQVAADAHRARRQLRGHRLQRWRGPRSAVGPQHRRQPRGPRAGRSDHPRAARAPGVRRRAGAVVAARLRDLPEVRRYRDAAGRDVPLYVLEPA